MIEPPHDSSSGDDQAFAKMRTQTAKSSPLQSRSGDLSRKGYLGRKTAWSTWKRFFYLIQDGVLIEFSREGSNRPHKVFSLDQYSLSIADGLTGQEFSFCLLSVGVARDPVYLQAGDRGEMQAWVASIKAHCTRTSKLQGGESFFLEALNDACVMASSDGTIVGCNSAFCVLYGYSRDLLLGTNVKGLMQDAHALHHDSYLANFAKTGKGSFIGTARQYSVRSASGDFVSSEISLGATPPQKGLPPAFIGRFRAIESSTDRGVAEAASEEHSS